MAEVQIPSPLPGIFYHRPSPDKPAFVNVGDTVAADQIIGLVEVMKQFAEVRAGVDGVLVAYLIDDNGTVGPGDALVTIETSV